MFLEVHFSPLHWAKYEGEKSTLTGFSKHLIFWNFLSGNSCQTKYYMSFLIWWELLRLMTELRSMLLGVWCWNIHWRYPLWMRWLVLAFSITLTLKSICMHIITRLIPSLLSKFKTIHDVNYFNTFFLMLQFLHFPISFPPFWGAFFYDCKKQIFVDLAFTHFRHLRQLS